jgi:hypothetical protein
LTVQPTSQRRGALTGDRSRDAKAITDAGGADVVLEDPAGALGLAAATSGPEFVALVP